MLVKKKLHVSVILRNQWDKMLVPQKFQFYTVSRSFWWKLSKLLISAGY